MNKFYGLLMQFTHGTTPCRKHLLKNYSPILIDESIELGYIVEIRKNAYGEAVYAITDLGKNIRDN